MKNIIYKFSNFLDYIAGYALVLVMLLVVANVVLRAFGVPIMGTVEFVGLLTAIAVGMSLAHCATSGGHIAVSLFFSKMSKGLQQITSILVNTVVFIFLWVIVWRLWIYAVTLRDTGQISLTMGISFYPFVMAIAVGFAIYSLVVLVKIADNFKGGVEE